MEEHRESKADDEATYQSVGWRVRSLDGNRAPRWQPARPEEIEELAREWMGTWKPSPTRGEAATG